MSANSIKDKSRQIAYTLVRVSFYVKRPELHARLENLAFELLEYAARFESEYSWQNIQKVSGTISALDGLVRLGYSIYEIEPVNANYLVQELDNLNSAIRQFGNSAMENREIAELSKEEVSQTENESDQMKHQIEQLQQLERSSSRPYVNLDELENFDNRKIETKSSEGENGNGNGLNAAIRQSAVAERIKSMNGDGVKLKDLIAEFPEVSERTLRYDLQKLCDRGVIERMGNGGPASYYVYRGNNEAREESYSGSGSARAYRTE